MEYSPDNAAIYILVAAINKFSIDIDSLYKKYDKSGEDKMSYDNFNFLVNKVGNNIQSNIVSMAFKRIDVQNKGYITLKEFKNSIL